MRQTSGTYSEIEWVKSDDESIVGHAPARRRTDSPWRAYPKRRLATSLRNDSAWQARLPYKPQDEKTS